MKYKKKPVVIEAVQFKPEGNCSNEFMGYKIKADAPNYNIYLEIPTLEGVMRANCGDYIIKGINGEFYPCKQDIFEKTYEKVEEGK